MQRHHDITKADQVAPLVLRLTFSDGHVQTVDVGAFLRASTNPLLRCYLDPDTFARFALRDGDLVWGDYDLCFPIADLYEDDL